MQRPTAVTVFGILNIAFGAMGLCCSPFALLLLVLPDQPGNPMLHLAHTSTAYRVWMLSAAGIGMLVAIVLIAAGIGLLRLKPWARRASIGYGIFGIGFGILGMIVNFAFIFGVLRAAGGAAGPQVAGAVGGLVGGLLGGCFGLIYPVLLLFFMTRPKIRDAFCPAPPPGALPPPSAPPAWNP